MIDWLLGFAWPIIWPVGLGAATGWAASQCRGRNAKTAFRYVSAAFYFLLLRLLPLDHLIPFGALLWPVLALVPTVFCVYMAGHTMMKEMRAQKDGDYTEAA